ncbi:MAG: hypothetical protein ACI9VR_001878 [Cognaticolwellia sp.]
MNWLLTSLAMAAADAPAPTQCVALPAPGSSAQVAWISPVRRGARNNQDIEVVLVTDLIAWSHANKADQTRVLQAMGYAGKRGGWRARRYYKVTLFEVPSEELCRPRSDIEEGEIVQGVRSCGEAPIGQSCGLSNDKLTGQGGLPVYQVPWRDAARWGFCVVPLELYLQES